MSEPPRLPPDLALELSRRGATVQSFEVDAPKVYVRARAAAGPLFAWYTLDGSQRDVLAYETTVRRVVGERGALAAPPILASGDRWRLEPAIAPEPIAGPALDAVLAAAAAIPDLDLPPPPAGLAREARLARLRRRLRVLRSALPRRDALRARGMVERSELPPRLAHGDFHPGHVLPAGGVAWVVDWELAGPQPAGYDLMTLWAHLDDAESRDRLFEGAVAQLGERLRPELLRLRYALVVRVIATNVSEPAAHNRDPERVRRLLALLPELRASAGV